MITNSLQEQAYQAIRKKIIYSDLEPGKKISKKSLEDMLQIGRTPIRESLIQLRQQELVYTIPQSGTYVSKIDLASAKNARFVREQLERKIMVECCTRIDAHLKTVLKTIIEEQEKAVLKKDERTFFHTDNLFHATCFEIAGRKEVWRWLEHNNTHLERFRWLRIKTEGLNWDTILTQHHQLFQALVSKNIEEADFLTSVHLHRMLTEQEMIVEKNPSYFK